MRKALILVWLVLADTASSSSCWVRNVEISETGRLADAVEKSELIFSGEVELVVKSTLHEVGDEEKILEVAADFIDISNFKGEEFSKAKIFGNPARYCSCSYDFKAGVSYIIFDIKTKDGYFLRHCDMVSTVKSPKYDILLEVVKVNKSVRPNDRATID